MMKEKMRHVIEVALFLTMSICLCLLPTTKTCAATQKYLTDTKLQLYVGNKKAISLTGGTKNTVWTSSKSNVVSVSKKKGKGVTLTAKKKGTAVIKAKLKGKTYSCKVVVKNPKLSETSKSTYVGSNFTLQFEGGSAKSSKVLTLAKFKKMKKNTKTIYWTVANSAYGKLSVNSKKQVTFVPKASSVASNVSTKIYAKYNGKTYTCSVKIWNQIDPNIPAYWTEELSNSIKNYNSHNTGSSIAKFLYITDTHWNTNTQRSDDVAKYLTKKLGLPFAVFGGDINTKVPATVNDAVAEIKSFVNAFTGINMISTTGNHDKRVSEKELYNLMYSRQTSYANVLLNGNCVYKDDTSKKIRYLTFTYTSYSYPSEEILACVEQRIKELDSGWQVVLFSHAYWDASKLVCDESKRLGDFLLNVEAESKADIAFWMVGHIHSDKSTYISNETTGAKILVVATDRDTYLDGGYGEDGKPNFGGNVMKSGTPTEQTMELVEIDRNQRKLYLTRVGAGKDREFTY